MKRSTNFNGMKRYRELGLADFVETCKFVGMTDAEIIEVVRKMQQEKEAQKCQPKPK